MQNSNLTSSFCNCLMRVPKSFFRAFLALISIDCSGNIAQHCQNIYFDGSTAPQPGIITDPIVEVADLMNMKVQSQDELTIFFDTNKLSSGIYTYRFVNGQTPVMGRVIVSK